MAQEITLPVKLQIENLQNITKEMRSQLGTLKVDSSGYKKLESVIMDIEKRIQQLQVISSRPFVDTKQFTAVSKEIIGIQDDLTKVRIEAGKVKFSDLQLDTSQKAKLEEFNSQIKNINDQLKAVKDSAKNTFFETDIGKAWKLNHADDAGKTFTQITKIIEGEVAKQERALHDAEKAQSDYQERLAARRKLSQFMKNGHSLTKENLGEDIYNSIFDKNGNFKGGGKSALQTWLEEQFKLDHNVVQSLTDQAGKKVREAFEDTKGEVDRVLKQQRTRINANLTEENTRTNKGQTYAQDIVAAQTSLDAAKATKEGLSQTNIKLAKTEEDLSNALRKAKLDRDTYMQAVTRAAAGQLQMGSSCDKVRAQLDSLNHTVDTGKARLASLDQATSKLQGISNFVNRYVGAYAIIRKVSTAIRNAFNNIKELDKVITSIAVVTNMSQEDLWNKVGQYTAMAQEYGVATKDVYSVSQIFYQQGLQTAQVMDLTTETLKMAKIAGIDYSQAANAMTVAVRAFKIEMEDAQRVTDAYSALAAKFAVSSAEIANAMEKTASSAASVGMSLESTSAFISVMEQTTRESAQNIGSALKSIISRYGEMKASPDKLLNVEGEEVAFNKVDTALASIGISIKDAAGQFRNFDDVIMELAAKWDTLDNNTQRYIATVMAGNRQQSRFIALVSNYDELSRAMNVASNSENASIVQVAKTMDSLESKVNQVKNAFSQLYLDLHLEEGLKGAYDWLTRILKTIGKLGTLNGVLPTLMNIVGFGTGTKSLLRGGMEWLQGQKNKWQVDTEEAKAEIERVREEAQKDIIAKYKVQADLSDLEAQKAMLESQRTQAETQMNAAAGNAWAAYQRAGGTITKDEFQARLQAGTVGGAINMAAIGTAADKQAAEQAVAAYNTAANTVNTLNTNIGQLDSAINTLKGSADQAQVGLEGAGHSGEQASQELNNLGNSATNQVSAAISKAQADFNAASAAADLARQNLQTARDTHVQSSSAITAARNALFLAEAHKEAARKALEKAQADNEGEQAERREAKASNDAAAADEREAGASNEKVDKGLSLTSWGSGNAMKYAGVATGVMRLLGTGIVATGASIQDKSTDNNERSKIWTGIGNGISSAGMGASMGMALGPWGAIAGAIGGFLLGGLGAILDGATMTLQERISLAQSEAKEAEDEALKKQARAIDLNSQIDNLKNLEKAMYNSTDDMQAYKDALNSIADQYPELVSAYDTSGDAIINIAEAEQELSQARLEGANAARSAAVEQLKVAKLQLDTFKEYSSSDEEYNKRTELEDYINFVSGKSNEEIQNQVLDILEGKDNTYLPSEIMMDLWVRNGSLLDDEEFKFSEKLPANELTRFVSTYVDPLKQWFEKNKESLGLTQTFESVTGHVEGQDYTIEQLQAALKFIAGQESKVQKQVELLNQTANSTTGYVELLSQLDMDNTIKQSQQTQLETTKNYQSLFTTMMVEAFEQENANRADDEKYQNMYDWQTAEGTNYVSVAGEIYNNFMNWYKNLGSLADEFATLDFTEYASADEIIKKFHITEENQEAFVAQFTEINQANRDRILNTIYNGSLYLNSDLKGLSQFSTVDEMGRERNPATSIANYFKEGNPNAIITKYADYFTAQLLEINQLAEDGYTQLASTRLDVLNTFANSLAEMTSEQQNAMFGIITNTDFGSYESIQAAIKNLQEYANKNGIEDIQTDKQLAPLYEALTYAANNLVFNINTLAQEVIETITGASSKIDSIIATNRSGLSFDKALEEYNNLIIKLGKNIKFGDLFIYDASLEKYVYSSDGLKAAIEQQQEQLNNNVTQLTTTYDKYTELFNSIPEFDLETDFNFDDNEDPKASLKSALSHYDIPKELANYQEQLINGFLATTDREHTWNEFQKYIKEQIDTYKIEKEKADQILSNFESNKKNQYFQNIDWSALALGTDYYGTNRTLLDELAPLVGQNVGDSWDAILESYLATIENESVREAARAKINDEIIQTKTSQYQTAISEIINYSSGQALSQATKDLFNNADAAEHQIANSAKTAILTAKGFLEELAKSIGQAGYTLEQYNQDAKSILEATLNNGSKEKSLLDFISEDSIGADTLEGLANVFGKRLDELVDVATGQVQGQLGQYMSYDFLAGKYDISGTFEQFIEALQADFGIIIQKGTKQYIEALKTWNERVINENNEIHKAVSEEINKVLSAKGGDQLNLAQTFGQLGDKINQDLLDKLTLYGADLSGGILTIHDGANIPAIVQELANIAAENGLLIPEELRALTDAINDVLDSMVSNIKSGINGTLSRSGARDLATWAKNNLNGLELSFTRTKEGLKLSNEQTEQLYKELLKVDALSAQIVLEELNESIEDSITGAKVLNNEIKAIRSTSESTDFSFMDNEIPGGQNNPLNYFSDWGKAFGTIRDSLKASGKSKGLVDYQDFYNVITEMGNLAEMSKQPIQFGNQFVSNAEEAAALIEQGASALKVASDGSIKVDLSQFKLDISGADKMAANIDAAIKQLSDDEVAILDSMIQLLETIVAMEEFSKIDIDSDGLDFSELFEHVFDEDDVAYYKWTEGAQQAATNILDMAAKLGKDSDLYKGLDQVKIGTTTMREMLESAKAGATMAEDQAKAYAATLAAFYKAMQSDDYDLDHIYESIKEILAGSDYEGDITVGDLHLVFHNGIVLEKDKEGNFIIDGKPSTIKDLEIATKAEAASQVQTIKDATKTINPETGTVTYTAGQFSYDVEYDVDSGQYTVQFSDGDSAIADSKEGINLAISTWAQKNKLTQEDLSKEADTTTSFTYTSHTGVTMDVEVDLSSGEIKFKNTPKPSNQDQAEAIGAIQTSVREVGKAQKLAAEEAAKEANATPTEVELDNVNVKVKEGVKPSLDLTDLEVETTGTLKDIQLDTAPSITLAEGIKPEFKLAENEVIEVSDKVNVRANSADLEIILEEGANKHLASTEEDKISVDDIPDVKGIANNIEIEIDSNTVLSLSEGSVVKVKEPLNVLADAQDLEINTGEGAFVHLSSEENSEPYNVGGIEQVKGEAEDLEIVVDSETNTHLNDNSVITIKDQLNAKADAQDLEITTGEGTFVHLSSEDTEPKDVGSIELVKGAAEDLEINADAGTNIHLTEGSVVTLSEPVNALGDINTLELNLGEGIDIVSSMGEREGLLDIGSIGDVKASVNTLNISEADFVAAPEEIEAEATIKAKIEDTASKQLETIKLLAENLSKIKAIIFVEASIQQAKLNLNEILDLETQIENASQIEVKIDQDLTTNDQTKAQLDSINQLLMAIRSNPTAFITILANMDELREILGLIEILIEKTIELKNTTPEINVAAPNAGAVYNQLTNLISQANILDALAPVVDVSINDQASSVAASIQAAINSITGKTVTVSVSYNDPGFTPKGAGVKLSTGNVGLSNAKGTLMGELGPELVVSNGRYFVAGQNGAEFVDLSNDAIVFNHLQTEQLLKHGMSKQRGQAVTNERNAVSFATGNVNGGPAMASAKAALAALKQLRAMWKSLAGSSVKDLAGAGGSGGGGSSGDKTTDPKVFVKQLEIWYNWLQKIASLEEKINYEEAKRNEISSSFTPSGKAYVQSLKESLDYLKEEAAIQQSLVESQQEYFKKRQNELNTNNGPFSQLYEFDDDGQLKYKNGKLEQLSELVGRDQYGNAKMTAEEQYKQILAINPELAKWMETDSSGNKIDKSQDDWYVTAVQAFWDKMDSDKEEMQSLHDSIEEHKLAVLEQESQMNEILHEIEDNQIDVENKVLNAIVESRQRAIDELQKERDALEKASTDLINGLSDQLQKERDMYDTTENKTELTSLQRQLAILQRSGGSASQIASLQKDISQRQQDAYFETQQAEIDALQEASDKQLEKLDQQIDLETEQLEYEKEHGLLWQQVYNYMTTMSAKELSDFIQNNTASYWSESATGLAKGIREDLFSIEKYKEVAEGPLGSVQTAAELYSKEAIEKEKEKNRQEEEAKKKKAEEEAAAKAEEEKKKASSQPASSGSGSSAPSGVTTYRGHNEYTHDILVDGVVVGNEPHTGSTSCSKCGWVKAKEEPKPTSLWDRAKSAAEKLKTKGRASGGYVDHGIYELGERGTETVLTAEQTQVLRNNILSNRPNSLISLLKSYNESYDGIGNAVNGISQVEDNSMVIEHIEMNMNVSKIADDYDAKRAGEQALQKMVEIARKTQAQNRIGR